MSDHRSVLNIHFVFFYICFLHACISRTLDENRQKRYSEADICHESHTTIEKVDICPQNIEILNRRSIKKNCSRYQSCTEDQLVYHCVMNGGGLVEVCAPRSLITGRFCPYYETGLGRVIENTRRRCIMCPFQYHSDEYMKKCIPANVIKEGSSGQSSSINANIATPKPNPSSSKNGIFIGEGLETQDSMFSFEVLGKRTEYGLNDESVASGEDLRNRQDTEKHTGQNDTYITVLGAVISICFCLVLCISLICFFRKRLKTFCSMHEDGQKHNYIQKDSRAPQDNDLCYESCEPMMLKKEYASF